MDAPGPSPAATLSIRPDAEGIRRSSLWLSASCTDRAVPSEQIDRLDLCLNEVLANVLDHAGAGALDQPVELALRVNEETDHGSARLVVSDGGEPFDPLIFTPAAVPRSLAEAVPGGLGIRLVRNFSDDLSYARVAGRNVLTMQVRWPLAV
jgi:serine/threonine-protein kinase RsbW